MSQKAYVPQGQSSPPSQIGATLEALGVTIRARRGAGEGSYTYRLLEADLEYLLSKIAEESAEIVEAAQEGEVDHLRYEVADLTYHLLVLLERFDIPLDELGAELNVRMTEEERPEGGVCLFEKYVKRGK